MFITLKIWFFIFIEYNVWHIHGNQLSRLRRERHRIRLAKAKEERYLELQRVPLINWKDIVLLDRGNQLMKNFIVYLFLLFLLSACGYTQLQYKWPTRTDQVSDTYIEKKKIGHNFWSSPTVGNFNTQPYRVYINYGYPYINYGYPYINYGYNSYNSYNSSNGAYQIHEQNLKINKITQELDQYKRSNTVRTVQKVSSPSSVIKRKKQKAAWNSRINPRHRKKVSATRKEPEKADASN